MKDKFKCQHPECSNMTALGICLPHIELMQREDTVIEQCALCSSLVAVFQKPPHLNQKYVWCVGCRNCTGTKESERKTYLEYPLEGRIVEGESYDPE